jgi:hypothetical protein
MMFDENDPAITDATATMVDEGSRTYKTLRVSKLSSLPPMQTHVPCRQSALAQGWTVAKARMIPPVLIQGRFVRRAPMEIPTC